MNELRMQEKGPRPHVRFETRSAEDRPASILAGRKIYKDVDWVIVTPSGGKDVREDFADSWLAKIELQAQSAQYDYEWARDFKKMYEMFKDGKEMPEAGTPLRMCTTMFTPAEIANCLGVNIRTLEGLADANEEALGRIGMGARALKTRAQEAVKTGDGKESAMKVEALEVRNTELMQRVADLTALVEEMREQMLSMVPPAKQKKQPETA